MQQLYTEYLPVTVLSPRSTAVNKIAKILSSWRLESEGEAENSK